MKPAAWSCLLIAGAWTAGAAAQPPAAQGTVGDGGAPSRQATSEVRPPAWLRQPSFAEMALAWPRKAASMGISGTATITCVVNTQGLMQGCTVKSEAPQGRGFGAAALLLAPAFLMKPAMKNGQPIEAEVDLPITFSTESGVRIRLPNAIVMATPAWSKAPSVAEIQSLIERKVGDKFADGKVVFMCNVNKTTGKVSHCSLANASPGMAQFRDVANALVPSFEVDPKALADIRDSLDPTETAAEIMLPFSFPDMASPSWGKRYVTHVVWAPPRPVLPPGPPTLPDAAVKAGLTDGWATVDCQIEADGGLSHCDPVEESTPGVGLGALAKTVAEGWVANRWTEEGLPVDGARIRLPVKMVLGQKAYVDPAPMAKPKM